MRQKCMTILKVSVALILALMMVVGSISTVVAATITIEQADSASDSTVTDVAADPADADDAADEPVAAASSSGAIVDKLVDGVSEDIASADTQPAQSAPLTDKLVRRVKEDIAGTGAEMSVASTGANSYKLETGARYYLNTYASDGKPFSDSATKAYVYCAFIWNDYKNYSIIKMDHIDNTDWYTCVTANGNIVDGSAQERRSDMDGICFFTSDSSTWATKSKYFSNSGAFSDIQNNAKVLDCYASSLDGRNAYNNHVYYYSVSGLTKDYSDGTLASSASETKTSWQKASVYVSTNGTSYSFRSTAGQGGEVQIGGYYWATNYTTSDKGFSAASTGTTHYSQYNNAVVTSWITLKVTDVYDGWHFIGWYDSSGNPAGTNPTSTTNYYQITSTDTFDVHARFLKPEYTTTGTPATESMRPSGSLVVRLDDQTVSAAWLWSTGSGHTLAFSSGENPSTNHIYYSGADSMVTTTYAPNAKFTDGSGTSSGFPSGTYESRQVNSSTSGSSTGIYYVRIDSSDAWSAFEHLGVTLTGNPATADPGDELTLTADTSGTLNDSSTKLSYYFQKNGTGSWYVIAADTTNTSVDFYPPDYGTYTFKVTATDKAGLETAVATSATTTTVGQVGYYVSGDSGLVGQNWGIAPYKGFMTAPSSGTIYTKTFGNVASGSHSFRITSLTDWITDSSTHGTYTVNGAAGSMDGNNFTFSLSDKQQVTITYDSSNHNVTVTTADVQAIDVVVYAGPGGKVEVTYGTATTEILENENATIKVAYGDSIDLEATGIGSEFSRWYKNLTTGYTGGKEEDDCDSLENEVITQRTVYVAEFSGGSSGSWVYSYDRSNATPEISGDASSYHMLFSTDKAKLGQSPSDENDTAKGNIATYKSGSDYWSDLTPVFSNNSNPTNMYFALSDNTSNSGIRGDKSNMKINGTTYSQGNGPTIKNTSDETLFAVRFQEHNDVSGSAYFIEVYNIDWSKINALGVRAVYTGSGGVNYKFYYKLSGGSSGGGGSSYIPSTNYYAKDSSIRDDNFNYWIYPTKTTVDAVDGQISVVNDHTDGHHWVDGFALKGSEITVSTVVPHRGQYKTVDKNGTTATDKKADEKYYVAGFSFNGVTPELISESSGESVTDVIFADYNSTTGKWTNTWKGSGTKYTCTYKIPADMKESMLEITPIIFVKDEYASETVMVYINGYNSEVQNAGWGNTLYMYPFYKYNDATYAGQGENFGRYPGQPIVNYGGQLFCQIPLTDDASKNGKDNNGGPIKGITINNGYYDDVHKTYCKHVTVHRQTYDYDDFAKIYNEKKTKNGSKYLYSIYFSFKYTPQNATMQHRLASTTNAIDADGDASRYNDLLSSDGILKDTSGTVASSTLITAGENSTGWEDLKDSLGNNVDIFGNKVTNASAEPLRVFSLGYEYNNAGRWATEWAVYYKSGDNYVLVQDPNKTGADSDKYSMIVPSALIFNDKASLSSATQLDSDLAINGYDGIYEALEAYRGVPVKICYEHDIPDAFNPKNYRCDGRWTYTTTDDYVRSNVKIEYYDKDGVLQDDTFGENSHVGNTTGCSAYFTNSAYYGATVSDSEIIDNSESYTFAAEAKGSYEFVGWYMYDTAGHESTITKDSLTADTPRSGNFTLAARFKYVASGNLTISNSLATNSVGRANTYLGVTLINGDKQTVVANVNSNTAPVTIDKSYINASSNYQIKIDIRTVPLGENTFKEYTCYTTNGSSGSDVRSAASNTNIYNASRKTNASDTYTVTVKASDIFSSSSVNDQIVKAIEYVSELNPVHYAYSVKYNYTSRQHGNQAFTRTGQLTAGQISDTDVVTGTLNTADKKLTKAFLAEIAPHESNFNEKITWNFDAVVNSQTCTYNSGTNTYNIALEIANIQQQTATPDADFSKARHGYFTVPYAQTDGVADSDGSGKVAKTADTTFTIDLNYDELFKIGDDYVTAPTVIYETVDGEAEPQERYFKYWEMSTVSSKRGDSRIVGRCYFPEFNYRALDNYNITAVYSVKGERIDGTIVGDESGSTAALIAENSYAAIYSAGKFTSIDFIGNSRNQWNNGDSGSASGTHATAGDLIYNDFILSFKPEGDDLFADLSSASCGVVIERVKLIETNSSGTNAKTLQEYAKDYSDTELNTIRGKIQTYVESGFLTKGDLTLMNRSVTKSEVNSKNRYHYVLPMYNNPTGSDLVGNNQKYLYRAYSYMIIDGKVTISDAPTYFYMYDIAVA